MSDEDVIMSVEKNSQGEDIPGDCPAAKLWMKLNAKL